MYNPQIYAIANQINLSLEERCKLLTAFLEPFKDIVMVKNEHWKPRHIRSIENTTGLLLLRDVVGARKLWEGFFNKFFQEYPHIESFGWGQQEDFNDSYLYYNVNNFVMNGVSLHIYTGLDGFEFLDDYLLDVSHMREVIWEVLYDETIEEQQILDYWVNEKVTDEMVENLYRLHFWNGVEAILVLFQGLYNAFTADYFVESFGWQSKILITREGIAITQ